MRTFTFPLHAGTHQLKKDWVTDAVITRPLKRLLIKELTAVQQLKEARSLEVRRPADNIT
jgi:hypothetical protein